MRFIASTGMFTRNWLSELSVLSELGIEGVELSAQFGPSAAHNATFNYTDPYEIEAVGKALEKYNLRVHSMHAPIFLGSKERNNFGVAGLSGLVVAIRMAIDAVASLGGRYVLTQDAAELLPPEELHLASKDILFELAEYADERGCVFCIENGFESPENFYRITDLVKEINHPGLGICIDTGHAQIYNLRDVPKAILAAGSFLKTCHLHDNLGSHDDHMSVGDGIIPWMAVFAAMDEVGYRGPYVIESRISGRKDTLRRMLTRTVNSIQAMSKAAARPAQSEDCYDVYLAGEQDLLRAGRRFGREFDGKMRAAVAIDLFGEIIAMAYIEGEKPEIIFGNPRRLDKDAIERHILGVLDI